MEDDGADQRFHGNVHELGTIKINARRVILHQVPIYAMGDTEKYQSISQVSEKVLKGEAITNSVR